MSESHIDLICEDFTYTVNRNFIILSNYMKKLSIDTNSIHINNVQFDTFKYVIEYLEFRKGEESRIVRQTIDDNKLSELIDEKDYQFINDKSYKILQKIAIASDTDLLDIPCLVNLSCLTMGNILKNHSYEEIQKIIS